MKKWSWRKILAIIGCCLVVVGLIPVASSFWLEYESRPEPFIMSFPLQKGEYTSSPFKTGFNGPSRIDLEWDRSIPAKQKSLDLEWKIVDDTGKIVAKGFHNRWIAGNSAPLYGANDVYRKGQRIVVTLPHDVRDVDQSMRVKITVDVAEIALDESYAGIGIVWAAIVAGPGAILLIVLAVRRARSNSTSPFTT